jgi:hypothetical protein
LELWVEGLILTIAPQCFLKKVAMQERYLNSHDAFSIGRKIKNSFLIKNCVVSIPMLHFICCSCLVFDIVDR